MQPSDVPPARDRRSPEHWTLLAVALAALAGLVLLGLALEPAPEGHGTHEALGLPPCGAMALFGVPCPGCGVTTAMVHAARGELATALAVQPLGLLLALAIALGAPAAVVAHTRGRDLGRALRGARAGPWFLGLAALVLLCWGYKLLRMGALA